MARPPLPLGTPGTITVAEESKGTWVARCRFRDYDGVTRRMAKFGATKTAARSGLHKDIEARQRGARGGSALTPASRFDEAAALFLQRVERRRADTTYGIYKGHLDNAILPALGALRLAECTVSRLDAYFEALEPRYSANTRRSFRSIIAGVMQQAVLHEAVATNPVRELGRIERPRGARKAGPRGRGEVGLEWMTPYTWRRTYATILDDEISFTERMKADLMGHAKFLENEYVSRGELHPDAAVVLDAAVR